MDRIKLENEVVKHLFVFEFDNGTGEEVLTFEANPVEELNRWTATELDWNEDRWHNIAYWKNELKEALEDESLPF